MSVRIEDSFLIRYESDMRRVIGSGICDGLCRSVRSLLNEWKGHNILYYMGLFRDHTKDVDFEDSPLWYISLAWWLLSRFYFIFEWYD